MALSLLVQIPSICVHQTVFWQTEIGKQLQGDYSKKDLELEEEEKLKSHKVRVDLAKPNHQPRIGAKDILAWHPSINKYYILFMILSGAGCMTDCN